MSLEWQQKLHALNALAECSLKMRDPGDWYVSQRVEVKTRGGSVLKGTLSRGSSPAEAVGDLWRQLVDELPVDDIIVVNAYRDNRREVRWNGFMWQDVCEGI